VVACRLDQLEDLERLDQAIPLDRAAGRVADLEVADPGARELATRRAQFDCSPDWPLAPGAMFWLSRNRLSES
jgi:hypothetical protein